MMCCGSRWPRRRSATRGTPPANPGPTRRLHRTGCRPCVGSVCRIELRPALSHLLAGKQEEVAVDLAVTLGRFSSVARKCGSHPRLVEQIAARIGRTLEKRGAAGPVAPDLSWPVTDLPAAGEAASRTPLRLVQAERRAQGLSDGGRALGEKDRRRRGAAGDRAGTHARRRFRDRATSRRCPSTTRPSTSSPASTPTSSRATPRRRCARRGAPPAPAAWSSS